MLPTVEMVKIPLHIVETLHMREPSGSRKSAERIEYEARIGHIVAKEARYFTK